MRRRRLALWAGLSIVAANRRGRGDAGDARGRRIGCCAGPVGRRVEILRDRAGVPHVYAETTQDLYFGLGVAMAEDRLWQIDRLRRRALGRQAEIMGPAYLASDIAHRTVGIPAIAAREAGAMDRVDRRPSPPPWSPASISASRSMRGALPPEFGLLGYAPEPFTVADLVAIGRGIWWSLNGRIDRISAAECARFLPDERLRNFFLTPEGSENLIVPDEGAAPPHPAGTDDATGSNNWALRPERTGTGGPILCGDPHQPFWVPSSWYEFALHGPEDDAAGAGHPGMPGMWWGSNGTLAWSITNNAASTRDLYREEIDGDRYRENGGWRPLEIREETIAVRGASPRKAHRARDVRGPIVNALIPKVAAEGDPPLSLRWVGAEHIDDFRAAIAVGRAKDRDGIRAALQGLGDRRVQLRLCRSQRQYRLPDGRPGADPRHAWRAASATPPILRTPGRAPSTSTTCRRASTRREAMSRAPTSG